MRNVKLKLNNFVFQHAFLLSCLTQHFMCFFIQSREDWWEWWTTMAAKLNGFKIIAFYPNRRFFFAEVHWMIHRIRSEKINIWRTLNSLIRQSNLFGAFVIKHVKLFLKTIRYFRVVFTQCWQIDDDLCLCLSTRS